MINIAEIIKTGVQIEVDALDALYIYITTAPMARNHPALIWHGLKISAPVILTQ